MSRFILVGASAMRDPLTGEPLEEVSLYVDADAEDGGRLPEINVKDAAQAFVRKMKAQAEETKTAS